MEVASGPKPPQTAPGLFRGAVRSERLRGEEQRLGGGGTKDPPEIVRGNLPPPGWDAVCTRQVIPLSSFFGIKTCGSV